MPFFLTWFTVIISKITGKTVKFFLNCSYLFRGLLFIGAQCMLLVHKVKYYKKLYLKSDLLHDVFCIYLVNSMENFCCNTVFLSLSTAINNIFSVCWVIIIMTRRQLRSVATTLHDDRDPVPSSTPVWYSVVIHCQSAWSKSYEDVQELSARQRRAGIRTWQQ